MCVITEWKRGGFEIVIRTVIALFFGILSISRRMAVRVNHGTGLRALIMQSQMPGQAYTKGYTNSTIKWSGILVNLSFMISALKYIMPRS
jgi:hypothetical protein